MRQFDALVPYLDVIPDLDAERFTRPELPHGLRFKPPWDGLIDLCDWMASSTGYDVLNLSDTDIVEGGVELPPWTLEDLRALMANWLEAQTLMNRANRLAAYIDRYPRARLPLLHRVLNQDLVALSKVTEPDPVANRPLIQVLV